MKGLLTKDFLTLKKKYGIVRVIIDLAIIITLMIVLESAAPIYICFLLLPLEITSMIISLTTCDEEWRWDCLLYTSVLQLFHNILNFFLFQISWYWKCFFNLCSFNNQSVGTFLPFHQLLSLLQNIFIVDRIFQFLFTFFHVGFQFFQWHRFIFGIFCSAQFFNLLLFCK